MPILTSQKSMGVQSMPIITARPEGWSMEDYKEIRKEQSKRLKERRRGGFLVFLASEIVAVQIPGTSESVQKVRNYAPYVKKDDGPLPYIKFTR